MLGLAGRNGLYSLPGIWYKRRMSPDSPTPRTPSTAEMRVPPAARVEQLHRLLGEDLCRQLGVYDIPPALRLSVVVPVYNERATVDELIRRVRAVDIPKEILVVDDGSTDGTRDHLAAMADAADLRVFFHERNRGKGAALRTAFEHVTGDIVIVQDADLEYDPSQYRLLIQPIVQGVADVVYGSRFVGAGPHRVLYFWHWVANRTLTTLSNMFTGLNLTDMETCYKVFRREVVAAVGPRLRQNRFGIDPELTAKVARRKYRVYEVGIDYFGRTYREGKKIGLRDAIKVLWCILRYGIRD
jgi:glycosyltransferase involved in cell wall biosynthesis